MRRNRTGSGREKEKRGTLEAWQLDWVQGKLMQELNRAGGGGWDQGGSFCAGHKEKHRSVIVFD